MTIQRQGDGPHWDVHLDGNTLVVGGLRLDLDTQQGATAIYALPDGSPTLERTDWLGALVEVPAYIGMESVVEIVNENGEVESITVHQPSVNLHTVRVELFSLKKQEVQDAFLG